MQGALFDSCAISYWHGGIGKFQAALVKTMELVRKEELPFLVSSVSVQELLSWVVRQGADAVRDFEKFMHEHFNVLDYLESCARQAAHFQVGNLVQKISPKSEMKLARDVWFRDAALAGTALHYNLPLIVTGDQRFAETIRRYPGFTGRVELLEETVMITVLPPAPPQPGHDTPPDVQPRVGAFAEDGASPNAHPQPQPQDVLPPISVARQDVALSPSPSAD